MEQMLLDNGIDDTLVSVALAHTSLKATSVLKVGRTDTKVSSTLVVE
jgi:hypothetical protein